jgi:hypothetical protein
MQLLSVRSVHEFRSLRLRKELQTVESIISGSVARVVRVAATLGARLRQFAFDMRAGMEITDARLELAIWRARGVAAECKIERLEDALARQQDRAAGLQAMLASRDDDDAEQVAALPSPQVTKSWRPN